MTITQIIAKTKLSLDIFLFHLFSPSTAAVIINSFNKCSILRTVNQKTKIRVCMCPSPANPDPQTFLIKEENSRGNKSSHLINPVQDNQRAPDKKVGKMKTIKGLGETRRGKKYRGAGMGRQKSIESIR